MKLSIIIPLYNEEENIVKVFNKLYSLEFPESISEFEIIIVNDFSTDNSASVVQEFIDNSNKNNIFLYHHEKNKGKGAAVRTGFAKSNGDLILIQDADLELSPDDIPLMINTLIKLNIQFVNGSRYMQGIIRPLASYRRYLANRLFTFLTSIIINVKLTDMACGYKLIHKNLYEKLLLKENRFGIEAEMLIKALRIKRNNIAEVPVQYFPRNEGEGKKFRNMDAIKILGTILKYGLFKRK